MFTFEDQPVPDLRRRHRCRRRAYIEAGMHRTAAGELWYVAPSSGRSGQRAATGSSRRSARALAPRPVLTRKYNPVAHEYLQRIGQPVWTELSSLGNPRRAADYLEELRETAVDSESCRKRCARGSTQPTPGVRRGRSVDQRSCAAAPLLLDRLAPDDAEHFARCQFLDDAGVRTTSTRPWCVARLLTRTVFELRECRLGARGVAGGPLHLLMSQTPASQPASAGGGIERMVLASTDETAALPVDVYVALGRDPRQLSSSSPQLRAESDGSDGAGGPR